MLIGQLAGQANVQARKKISYSQEKLKAAAAMTNREQCLAKGAFTLSSKVFSKLVEQKGADIAVLLGANLSNTRRANSSSIDFAR
jgi:hypothetical protein